MATEINLQTITAYTLSDGTLTTDKATAEADFKNSQIDSALDSLLKGVNTNKGTKTSYKKFVKANAIKLREILAMFDK